MSGRPINNTPSLYDAALAFSHRVPCERCIARTREAASYDAALCGAFPGEVRLLADSSAQVAAGCPCECASIRGTTSWRDLIAVCEDVCAKGWTSPRHLAIGGRSAGGITVGRAMTERPDLFAAVIDGVGWSNPLRYVAEPNGYGEEP